jgi:geranylgeranyl diphosphate synthase type II
LTMFDLPAYLERNKARIDQALDGFLPPVTRAGRLAEAMRYSVMAGGKRLRPNLCLAAAEAVGGDSGDAMAAACALEMIHTYSLIHDDLPAMDNDRLRRGRPTCHIAFDEATAILAGDALLTLAFEIVAVHSPGPVERRTEVVRLLASAAGPAGMVGGQMLDMLSEGRALDQTELEGLHRLKTGALIEASLACGAVLAGGSGAQLDTLHEYGRLLGLAFQVTDDILNVEGDPSVMGKAAGTDVRRNKSCYPGILGLVKSKEFAQNLVQQAVSSLSGFDAGAAPLRAIARYVVERKK